MEARAWLARTGEELLETKVDRASQASWDRVCELGGEPTDADALSLRDAAYEAVQRAALAVISGDRLPGDVRARLLGPWRAAVS